MCTCMAGNKIQGVIKKSTAHKLSVSTGEEYQLQLKSVIIRILQKAQQPAFSLATEVPAA